jgi:diguanylate cyclase (GGDEF)-like protein
MGWVTRARAQMWPGLMTPKLMARTSGACFVFGGIAVTLVTLLTPSSFSSTAVQYGNAAVAGLAGLVVLWWDQRMRLWQFLAMVAVATLQITVSVMATVDPVIAVSFATLYVFVSCAAFFVAWPVAALLLSLAVACCLAAFGVSSTAPWWSGLVASGTTAVIGIVIANLGRMASNAEMDEITGLANRRGFDRMVSVAIGRAQSGGPRFVVAFLCVDGYGAIREEFGGQAGDQVLQVIATAWCGMVEPEQILARRGVDEFAVMLPGATEQEAVSLVDRMRSTTSTGCSAGVTAWQPGESLSVTLARADTALRRAKRGGRDRTMVESADLQPLAMQLRDALAADTVSVYYQPIVNLTSGDPVGVEALVRWAPPSHPDLAAAEVVKVAEESNLIAALGHYVLRRACLDARWMQRQAPGRALHLSVNVSGLQLVQDGYAASVFGVLAETGWPAGQLVLEVTESVLDVDRPSSIIALREFRVGGVRIAIDDFGTGYSSLSRLQALPSDLLKLDASFISAVTPSTEVPPLLQAVASLAEALHLPVVAEGVETAQQASLLRRLGFAMAQGFYYGRPQTREELADAMTPPPAVETQPTAVP